MADVSFNIKDNERPRIIMFVSEKEALFVATNLAKADLLNVAPPATNNFLRFCFIVSCFSFGYYRYMKIFFRFLYSSLQQ